MSTLEFGPLTPLDGDARARWAKNRRRLEARHLATKRYGGQRRQHWYAIQSLTHVLGVGLKVTGLYQRGVAHARDLRYRELELRFAHLPAEFDGLRILHLSDLHFEGMPDLDRLVLEAIGDREFDLCLLNGDYRLRVSGEHRLALASLERLIAGVRAQHGSVAVLGNHDSVRMVEPMEAMGIRVLVNESLTLRRSGAALQLIGTDDVHYFFTPDAVRALQRARDAFTIALVHSAELYEEAATAGVDLYLCGHSHAGQICLPWGIPIITHLRAGRAFFRGQWRHGAMRGVTNSGAGTSGIPVRFNSRGEVLGLVLRRG